MTLTFSLVMQTMITFLEKVEMIILKVVLAVTIYTAALARTLSMAGTTVTYCMETTVTMSFTLAMATIGFMEIKATTFCMVKVAITSLLVVSATTFSIAERVTTH